MLKFYRYFTFLFITSTLFFLVVLPTRLYAQNAASKVNILPPLLLREVSGIVKDTTDTGIQGTTVRLTSEKDTLTTRTNADGIFVFKNVKSATYTMSINSLGYAPWVAKFKQNDAIARIVMDPLVLKPATRVLDEVVVNGSPSIAYKTDTVEYKAKDYVVRPNATVDELLKKMEGMEVGNDGSLNHQGTAVTKAKINGKIYLGGDVATAIQNLPAEIVDKVQIVDDYGDQAARTGIKDGDPEKILNIVTRVDKSVGNTANIAAGVGNNDRYEGTVFATRLNGNQIVGLNARLNNTVNGIANSDSQNGANTGQARGNNANTGGNTNAQSNSNSGSGGTTNTGNNSFSYRDQLSKKVKINTNYKYNFNTTEVSNSSLSQMFSSRGTIFSSNESLNNNNTKAHNFSSEIEIDFNKNNFLRISPSLSYSFTGSESQATVIQTGLIHQDQKSLNRTNNTRPNLGGIIFYQHIFANPRRNLSVQANLDNAHQDLQQERNADIIYYQNTSNVVLKDSLIHRLVARANLTKKYRASITFAEPLTDNTQLEFNGQINYNGYDNTATTSNINSSGLSNIVDSLSNIYDYSFTQYRIALNYRYGVAKTAKFKFSFGVTAVPGLLSGTKASLGTSTYRTSFNLIPIARFQYLWSKQHSMQVNYSGNAVEPTFDQIQPVRDVSNPQNPVVGNPNLKVTFNHTINTVYNNYISNLKLNYTINTNTIFTEDAVVRNVVQVRDDYNSLKNETRYLNLGGVYRINGNYSITKQLANRKYNLSLSGNIAHNHGVSMSNNIKNITTTWTFNERLGPRLNPTTWLEVNPFVSYTFIKSNNTLPTSLDSKTKTLALNIDGKFYPTSTLIFGYSASKNYVSGINSNITNNPLVINGYLQKELWKRKISVTFQAFDLLNQNNFINRNITDNAIIDTKSNSLSRYFMLRITAKLQKWTGTKPKNAMQMMRMGDGSFMQ